MEQYDIENIPIRREVDADNSCLFSSIAYLIDRNNYNEESSLIFRQHIIDYLLDNNFDEKLLDEPKDKYLEFIQNPKNWGGALEVKMFSDIFNIQIVCIDVKTNRADIYGEDKQYPQRIYLLYNGVHYDPLVFNYDVSADSLTDITIFDSNNESIMILFKSLLLEYKNKGEYADFSSMKCKICDIKCINENEALEHSINTQHWEYDNI